ncbi:unnamed protein product [Cyprideis torosa]|uniref:Coatomer subunit epsilon n=1 Tax=Cyprideis torosa TaxID=163714 RepID=A0A7R8W555_9CRUS|nr:unnamed protein product [Cyprideis torosa]CAG0879474.1 unnamed protein product [Cyprideis torosa]
MTETDNLFDVKNNYYLGHYQACINQAMKAKVDDDRLEKDIFMYRAYIAQRKYAVVLDEIHGASPADLQSVKMLAEFLSKPNKRVEITNRLDEEITKNLNTEKYLPAIMAAYIYYLDENFEAALRVLHPFEALECRALMLQTYLRMNRIDLARKELKSMQEKDDDATLTQLAQAWTNLASGGEKLQDAYYISQELIDKFGASPILLNIQAASFIGQGKLEEAEGALQEALEKDPNNADTLINMVVLSQSLGKPPEVSNRHLSQIKETHADHPFLKSYQSKEDEFERLVRHSTGLVEA